MEVACVLIPDAARTAPLAAVAVTERLRRQLEGIGAALGPVGEEGSWRRAARRRSRPGGAEARQPTMASR